MADGYEDTKIPGLTREESAEYLSLQERIEEAAEDDDPSEVTQAELRQFQQYNEKLDDYLEEQHEDLKGRKAMNEVALSGSSEEDETYQRMQEENEKLEVGDDAAKVAKRLVSRNQEYASELLAQKRGQSSGPTDDLAQQHISRQDHETEQQREDAYAVEHGREQDPSEYEDREGHNAAEGMDADLGPSQDRVQEQQAAAEQEGYQQRLRQEHGERTATVATKLNRLEDSLDRLNDAQDRQYVQRIREQVEEEGVESIKSHQLQKLRDMYPGMGSDGSSEKGSIRREYELQENQIENSSTLDREQQEQELDDVEDAFHDALDQQDVIGEISEAKREERNRGLGARLKDRLGL